MERLMAQLAEPAGRERAIDGLLVLVREAPAARRPALSTRVAHALAGAYREDLHRGAIVAALALLKAPEGEEVFSAALADFNRGGEYFEAAIRSARLLGELGLKARAPALIKALEAALAAPRQDRNTWFERTLILALDRLGDERAVPALIKVLGADPVAQDFYLNKMAARALGKLRASAAVPALVRSLGASSHGLLLLEESRRALCRIGAGARDELLRAATAGDHKGAPSKNAAGALLLLGDLGDVTVLPRLQKAAAGPAPADDDLRVALGLALLRLGDAGGNPVLLTVLDRQAAPLTARGEAARLLGLYGAAGDLGQRLESACKAADPSGQVLCWRIALAHARLEGSDGAARLDRLAAAKQDKTTAQYLARYRPRLKVPVACAAKNQKWSGTCLHGHLADKDWRVRERAALELGRGDATDAAAAALAARYGGEHDQVKRAILIGLERAALADISAPVMLERLPARPTVKKDDNGAAAPSPAEGEAAASPALRSRLLCLGERLRRVAGAKTKIKTKTKTEKR